MLYHAQAVVPRQSVFSPDPEVAFVRLEEGIDRILWQAILAGPPCNAVFVSNSSLFHLGIHHQWAEYQAKETEPRTNLCQHRLKRVSNGPPLSSRESCGRR